jgi:ribose transport system permease protein
MRNEKAINQKGVNELVADPNPLLVAFKEKLGIFGALVVICVFLSFASPYFLTFDNIINVFLQISINAIAAYGMTFIIILGGIDLSTGGVMLMVGILTTGFMANNNMPMGAAIALALALAAGVGFCSGFFSTKARIPSFIVTLGMANVTRGIGLVYSDGKPIYVNEEAFNQIGNGQLGGVLPYPIIYMIIVFAVLFIILNYTRAGRHIYAAGGNEEAARFSGIKTHKLKIAAFTLGGFLAGFGGLIISSRVYSGQPTIGNGAELDAIAAVVLGGASLSGGVGTLTGTLIGALVLGVITNGLNLLGVNSYWQYIAKGIVILVAVYAASARSKKMEGA